MQSVAMIHVDGPRHVIVLVLVVVVVVVIIEGCQFPDFVQSRRTGFNAREWVGHVTQEGASDRVTFDGRHMRVTSDRNSSSARQYRRDCLIHIGEDKYLSGHHVRETATGSTTNLFVCMHFLRRSEAVIQIRSSATSRWQDPRLCAENQLHLDDWPLIDTALALRNATVTCPLNGVGYDVTLYDRKNRRGVCDAYVGETRLEAGCTRDENGILFRFRFAECIPSGLRMRSEQALLCSATWRDGNDVFAVMTSYDDRIDVRRTWCLRLPAVRHIARRSFTAFLYRDFVCDRHPVQDVSTDVIVIDMKPSSTGFRLDPDHDLCQDDYEGCRWDVHRPACPSAHCRKSCDSCNASMISWSEFSPEVAGRWRTPETNDIVSIDRQSISWMTSSGHDVGLFRCIAWSSPSHGSDYFAGRENLPNERTTNEVRRHLVLLGDNSKNNGCRSRVACVEFCFVDHQSLTGIDQRILRYRISEVRPWPFQLKFNDDDVCSEFTFRSDALTGSTMNILIRANSSKYVECLLPMDAVDICFASVNDSSSCVLRIAGSSTGSDSFRIRRSGCGSDGDDDDDDDVEFRCLDRFASWQTDDATASVVITGTARSSVKIGCWVIVSRNDSGTQALHLVGLVDCDQKVYERILNGQVKPQATYYRLTTGNSSKNCLEPVFTDNSTMMTLTSPGTSDDVTEEADVPYETTSGLKFDSTDETTISDWVPTTIDDDDRYVITDSRPDEATTLYQVAEYVTHSTTRPFPVSEEVPNKQSVQSHEDRTKDRLLIVASSDAASEIRLRTIDVTAISALAACLLIAINTHRSPNGFHKP